MPDAELDPRYSEPEAPAVPWSQAEDALVGAPLFWITTVRPDGRPHVTPLVGVWHDGALHFSTGAGERKGRNLAANPAVALTTGTNALHRAPTWWSRARRSGTDWSAPAGAARWPWSAGC